MRTYPKPPTPSQLALDKKLRELCRFFASLNSRNDLRDECNGKTAIGKEWDLNYLPDRTVDEINEFLADHDYEPADLMAIRHTPGRWDQKAYDWLWILHRYQNRYGR